MEQSTCQVISFLSLEIVQAEKKMVMKESYAKPSAAVVLQPGCASQSHMELVKYTDRSTQQYKIWTTVLKTLAEDTNNVTRFGNKCSRQSHLTGLPPVLYSPRVKNSLCTNTQ